MFDMMLHCLLVKNIPTVLLTLSCRQEWFGQLVIWSIAVVSLAAARSFVLACTCTTVSSAYICILILGQTNGRSLIYRLNKSGPSIDPCGTPVHKLRAGER